MGQMLCAMDREGTVKMSVISAPDIPERARQIHGCTRWGRRLWAGHCAVRPCWGECSKKRTPR